MVPVGFERDQLIYRKARLHRLQHQAALLLTEREQHVAAGRNFGRPAIAGLELLVTMVQDDHRCALALESAQLTHDATHLAWGTLVGRVKANQCIEN